jgi:peptidoglycan/LPS O-acetylase OafA/YrhL
MKVRGKIAAVAPLAFIVLLGAFTLAVTLQQTTGYPLRSTAKISPSDIKPATEGFLVASGKRIGLLLQGDIHSKAVLLEDGVALPFRRSSIEAARDGGPGSYFVSHKAIYFQPTSSSVSPGGHRYQFVSPAFVTRGWLAAAVAAFFAALFGTVMLLAQSVARRRGSSLPATEAGPPVKVQRKIGIDVLRGVAVTLVVAFRHTTPCPEAASSVLHHTFSWLWAAGWIGVDLFFVISGFLVSGLLFSEASRTGSVRVGRFLMRRGCKIYPGHWVMIAVSVFLGILTGQAYIGTDNVIGELLYLQNYVAGLWAHTWTLAVEEHFYLLLGFMFAMAVTESARGRVTTRWVPYAFLLFALLCLGLRVIRTASGADAVSVLEANYTFSHLRIDSLMFGVFLQYFRQRGAPWVHFIGRHKLFFISLGTALFALVVTPDALKGNFFMPINNPWIATIGFSVNYLGGGLLLLALCDLELGSRKSVGQWTLRPLAWIGRSSYAIYLWHVPLNFWVIDRVLPFSEDASATGWLFYFVVHFGSAIMAGLIAEALVEAPVLRWRDRNFPVRSSQALPPQDADRSEQSLEAAE